MKFRLVTTLLLILVLTGLYLWWAQNGGEDGLARPRAESPAPTAVTSPPPPTAPSDDRSSVLGRIRIF